jgi:hypothetical protein
LRHVGLTGAAGSPITYVSYFTIMYEKEKRAMAMTTPRNGVSGRMAASLFGVMCCPRAIWPSGDVALPRGKLGHLRCPLVTVGHFAEINRGCPSMLRLPLSLSAAAPPPLTLIV